MIAIRHRPFVAIALPLILAACAGLLGGGKPAQLYRFGQPSADPETTSPAAATSVALSLSPVRFAGEIDSDRMLAIQGAQASYIKGVRWVSPAPALFEQAHHEGFRRSGVLILIVSGGDGIATAGTLRVDVDRFEAAYPSRKVAPTVALDAIVTLVDRDRRDRQWSSASRRQWRRRATTCPLSWRRSTRRSPQASQRSCAARRSASPASIRPQMYAKTDSIQSK